MTPPRLVAVKKEIDKTQVPSSSGKMRKSKRVRRTTAAATDLSMAGDSGFGTHQASTLSAQDVAKLMVEAGAPTGVEARVPESSESPESPPVGWFCMYDNYISKCHLQFPLPVILMDLLDWHGLALPQLSPAVIRLILAFIVRSTEQGVKFGIDRLMDLYTIKENPPSKGARGTYYLSARPYRKVFQFAVSDDEWRRKFFFVKADPRLLPEGRSLRSTWGCVVG